MKLVNGAEFLEEHKGRSRFGTAKHRPPKTVHYLSPLDVGLWTLDQSNLSWAGAFRDDSEK